MITPQTRLIDDPLDVSRIDRVPNPNFDRAMQAEGVTCATCHVRVDQAGESVVVASERSGRAPHPVRAQPKALRTVCHRCHDPGPGTITPTFFCWFESRREGLAHGVKSSCVDCHMPPVNRPVAAGGPKRQTRHHYWTGGGVPKTFAGYDSLLARDYTPGGRLEAQLRNGSVEVTFKNVAAGHHVTSGDPERHVVVLAEAVDVSGAAKIIGTRRFGQDWDWGSLTPVRPARRVGDSRLHAGGNARWQWAVPAGTVELQISAAHIRLTPANAAHMKHTTVPAEVRALWPEAPAAIADIENRYPMMTWFDRVTWRDGSWHRTPLTELLAESKSQKGVPAKLAR
ncbi:MAG: hypothetical protein AAFU77_10650 [Myxococcota bacterium]